MKKHLTRRGDGALIEMTSEELMRDIELGTQDAAEHGREEDRRQRKLQCGRQPVQEDYRNLHASRTIPDWNSASLRS